MGYALGGSSPLTRTPPNEGCPGRLDAGQSFGVDVAVAFPADFSEPISPELVLVSPPDVARAARSLLSIERPAPGVVAAEREFGAIELTAVWFFSVAGTLGPLLLYLLASRTS